jgi:hypothetical protein
MFVETLSQASQNNLDTIARTPLAARFYLAGGTAAALHLGHRLSHDLDFFSGKEFDPALPRRTLAPLGNLSIDQESEDTFLGTFNGVRLGFFLYPYRLLEATTDYQGVSLAGLPDIAAMKLEAIAGRGKKRDFIDLYFICRGAFSLSQIMALFEQKFEGVQYSKVHLLKSLTYFADAEEDEMPYMLEQTSWEAVKRFLESEARNLYRREQAM